MQQAVGGFPGLFLSPIHNYSKRGCKPFFCFYISQSTSYSVGFILSQGVFVGQRPLTGVAVYASYMYLDHMSPRYVVAMSVNCCTSFLGIVAATVLRFMLVRLNKKLDRGIYVEGAINALPGEAAQHGFRFKV